MTRTCSRTTGSQCRARRAASLTDQSGCRSACSRDISSSRNGSGCLRARANLRTLTEPKLPSETVEVSRRQVFIVMQPPDDNPRRDADRPCEVLNGLLADVLWPHARQELPV